MTVKDILEVSSIGTEVYPLSIFSTDWVLCGQYWNTYNKDWVQESFQKNLKKREKAHERALKRVENKEGYSLLPFGFCRDITILNRNINDFNELLNMEVAKISSSGGRNGVSSVVVFVKDIYVVSVI